MKAVITGSAGFLGAHVSREFVSRGYEAVGYDQKPTTEPGVRGIVGDLLDVDALTRALDGAAVVAHIGAIGDVYLAAEKPDLAAQVNVTGTTNVAEAARRTGTRVIYASTWEVYGDPDYEPLDEKHPCRPDHPYNITKLGGEQMLLSFDRLKDVPSLALRLGTAYGLGMRPNSVFQLFINKAKSGEPITIQGDGSQGRQFTHASDIARAFVLAAESDERGRAFNVVSSEMISIKQLAEVVIERYPTTINYAEQRAGDIAPAYVSADLVKEALGWTATMGFEDGMTELLDSAE